MFCLEPLRYQDAFLNRCELALAAMEGNENVLSYYKCVYTRSMWFWNTIWPCELKTFVFQLLASLIKKRKKAKIIKKNAKPLNPIIFGLVPFFLIVSDCLKKYLKHDFEQSNVQVAVKNY